MHLLGWIVALQACTMAVLLAQANSEDCKWTQSVGSKDYSFNLGASSQLHPHGARSEDGYYKVIEKLPEGRGGEEATFWFQLCEHMKFNSAPPQCQTCPQSCGGSQHCGETCNALVAVSRNGYSKCVTVASSDSGHATYALMDETNPALGVSLNMTAGDSDGCPEGLLRSLKVNVACAANGVVTLPASVRQEPEDSCQYVATMVHPSGCPVVMSTAGGGVGFFGLFFILLLCGAIVYFVLGLAYRTLVLGVSGIEAIPNLEFWRQLPSHVQGGWTLITEKIGGLFQSWTSSNYSRVA